VTVKPEDMFCFFQDLNDDLPTNILVAEFLKIDLLNFVVYGVVVFILPAIQ
jgi:hypothetical protein